MFSIALFALVFAHTPFENHYAHTGFFVQLIFFRFLVVAANLFEAPVRTRASDIFLVVYGTLSVVLPVLFFVDFQGYEETGAVAIPWRIVAAFDYGWFICLALTTRFLPPAPRIKATWSLE